jgi:hypothetical protein
LESLNSVKLPDLMNVPLVVMYQIHLNFDFSPKDVKSLSKSNAVQIFALHHLEESLELIF